MKKHVEIYRHCKELGILYKGDPEIFQTAMKGPMEITPLKCKLNKGQYCSSKSCPIKLAVNN